MLKPQSFKALVLVVAVVAALLSPAASAQTRSDVEARDQLIADQGNLLNAYRCLFAMDTAQVPGGCPSPDVILPDPAPEDPTQQDIDEREGLIQSQETMLNVYRCRFDVDMQLVPGGCLDRERATAEVRPQDDGSLLVYSDIVIEATPEQVWEVLTDFEAMPDWSSSLQGVVGDLSDGGQATAIFLSEGELSEFPHILTWEEGRSFSWSDELLFAPGIVDHHQYIVDRTDGVATLFVQTDQLTGDNATFPAGVLAGFLQGLYAQFNQELKAEVERRF
ncbi:SRPBCC family protein [Candidatus Poriferisocius sp.]|uniref:SRPBCC family protein n=1 Tax=Candidatus Poriferisocius sp. TaxID=3101276 RepID=UPI003B01C448